MSSRVSGCLAVAVGPGEAVDEACDRGCFLDRVAAVPPVLDRDETEPRAAPPA